MASPAQTDPFRFHIGTSEDLDDVMVVMDSAFGSSFGEAWTRSQLSGILPMANVVLTVVRSEAEGEAAGFSLSRTITDEAELLLIAVAEPYRRRGVARSLLDRFIEAARADGVARVHLEVRNGNPAVTMYSAAGFEPVGKRRNYYRGDDGSRHDAITLARNL